MTATVEKTRTSSNGKTPPAAADGLPPLDVTMAPLASIDEHPKNPRQHFDQEKLKHLADSFRRLGVLTPLLVRPQGKRLEVLGGHRRYRAAKLARLTTVPVQIRQVSDQDALVLMAADNDGREELTPLEKARSIELLITDGGMALKAAGERLGYSESWAKNTVRLLRLPPFFRRLLDGGELPERVARYLLPVAEIDAVMAELQHEWEFRLGDDEYDRRCFFENPQSWVDSFVRQCTRPLGEEKFRPSEWTMSGPEGREAEDGVTLRHYELPEVKAGALLPELTDELRQALDVRKVNGREVATNAAAYDDLVRPRYDKKVLAKAKRDAKRWGSSEQKALAKDAGQGKKPTPAQQAAKEKERAKARADLLAKRLHGWFFRWCRLELAEAVQPGDWQSLKLLAWVLGHSGRHVRTADVGQALADGLKEASRGQETRAAGVAHLHLVTAEQAQLAACKVAQRVLYQWEGWSRGELLHLDEKLVAALVADYGLDLTGKLWGDLLRAQKGSPRQTLLAELWGYFPKAELARRAGAARAKGKSKPQLIEALTALPAALMALPGCAIKPPKQLEKLQARHVPDVLIPMKRAGTKKTTGGKRRRTPK